MKIENLVKVAEWFLCDQDNEYKRYYNLIKHHQDCLKDNKMIKTAYTKELQLLATNRLFMYVGTKIKYLEENYKNTYNLVLS